MKRYIFFVLALVLGFGMTATSVDAAGCCVLHDQGPGGGVGDFCVVVDLETGDIMTDAFHCSLEKEASPPVVPFPYVDLNEDGTFTELEDYDLTEGDAVIDKSIIGAFAHPNIGPLSDGSSTSNCSMFNLPNVVSIEYGTTAPECLVGKAFFSDIDDAEKTFLFSLADGVVNKLGDSLANTCCIPQKKELGLTCHPAAVNQSFVGVMKSTIQGAFSGQPFNFFDVSNWWTCSENGFEALWSKSSNGGGYFGPPGDGSHNFYLMQNTCNDVLEGVLPPEIATQLENNENLSTGVKFTTAFWCSVKDETFVKYCACNTDFTECHPETFAKIEQCEAKLPGLGDEFLKCTPLSPVDDFAKGIENCEDFANPKDPNAFTDYYLPNADGLNQIKTTSAPVLLGRLLNFVVIIAGSVALIVVLYGGGRILTSAGYDEQWKKGLMVLAWGAIGLIVVLAAYAIAAFLLSAFA